MVGQPQGDVVLTPLGKDSNVNATLEYASLLQEIIDVFKVRVAGLTPDLN